MTEEERIFNGAMFSPGVKELRDKKLKAHNLSTAYNQTFEDEVEKRSQIISELFEDIGENCRIQGPIYIHYGSHTHIGNNFFANFNLTIQDDTHVFIGDSCAFGPGVTIVTPIHPMMQSERGGVLGADGVSRGCYAHPVKIGNCCWIGANVTICPGVTIGDNCVIGAGSVVTKDIPANSFAAGVPCRVIREITDADSIRHKQDFLGNSLADSE